MPVTLHIPASVYEKAEHRYKKILHDINDHVFKATVPDQFDASGITFKGTKANAVLQALVKELATQKEEIEFLKTVIVKQGSKT